MARKRSTIDERRIKQQSLIDEIENHIFNVAGDYGIKRIRRHAFRYACNEAERLPGCIGRSDYEMIGFLGMHANFRFAKHYQRKILYGEEVDFSELKDDEFAELCRIVFNDDTDYESI